MKNLAILALLSLPLAAGTHGRGPRRTEAAKAPVHAVNLNTATLTELMQLPKVGAKTAERIVAWRREHGGFKRPEEVMHVKGVGEKGFQRLKPFLQGAPSAVALAVHRPKK